jgi:AP-1 complex subunit beta-1
MQVSLVKYNPPVYITLAKLDNIIRLNNPVNIAQVFSELMEYSTEVDIDLVRKFVWAIYDLTNLDEKKLN